MLDLSTATRTLSALRSLNPVKEGWGVWCGAGSISPPSRVLNYYVPSRITSDWIVLARVWWVPILKLDFLVLIQSLI